MRTYHRHLRIGTKPGIHDPNVMKDVMLCGISYSTRSSDQIAGVSCPKCSNLYWTDVIKRMKVDWKYGKQLGTTEYAGPEGTYYAKSCHEVVVDGEVRGYAYLEHGWHKGWAARRIGYSTLTPDNPYPQEVVTGLHSKAEATQYILAHPDTFPTLTEATAKRDWLREERRLQNEQRERDREQSRLEAERQRVTKLLLTEGDLEDCRELLKINSLTERQRSMLHRFIEGLTAAHERYTNKPS